MRGSFALNTILLLFALQSGDRHLADKPQNYVSGTRASRDRSWGRVRLTCFRCNAHEHDRPDCNSACAAVRQFNKNETLNGFFFFLRPKAN